MLTPQALLNARRRSTTGMSLSLITLWHFSGVLSAGLFLAQPGGSIWLVLSMGSMALLCCVIEAQAIAFRPSAKQRNVAALLTITTVFLAAASACTVAALSLAMRLCSASSAYLVGGLMPSLLVGLGFMPQIWVFLTTSSLDGYSFGVTVLDVVGSAANTAVVLASKDGDMLQALAAAAPFLTIVAMHIVLISVALAVHCRTRWSSASEGRASNGAMRTARRSAHPEQYGCLRQSSTLTNRGGCRRRYLRLASSLFGLHCMGGMARAGLRPCLRDRQTGGQQIRPSPTRLRAPVHLLYRPAVQCLRAPRR